MENVVHCCIQLTVGEMEMKFTWHSLHQMGLAYDERILEIAISNTELSRFPFSGFHPSQHPYRNQLLQGHAVLRGPELGLSKYLTRPY